MAKKDAASAKNTKPKKRRWYKTFFDAYKVAQRTYPWIGWAMLALFVGTIAIGVVVSILTTNWVMWLIFFIMLALLGPLILLTQLVKNASYQQIDGMPGASGAVLNQLKRGWVVAQEPVRFNARSQEMVFRVIGRPGVVLIGEGSRAQVNKMFNDERKAIKRIVPSAPVQTVHVGHEEGQVPLKKLQRTIAKLPKKISNAEVAALTARFDRVNTNSLPIPKGIDPNNIRANRRAMRG
ncbi:MAG: DUF4191 domain-containing protein [Actinomycetaceae bacterium]|nr:DUF4191 domain-containing protein [Arcanobacterium sp.]MDD7504779.1 DUF4191 domain-containing protein [Actinomycetaceae bacterium]MDY6143550.1 DUF4191 domain-containing protein [Arcanobacterium sp.]